MLQDVQHHAGVELADEVQFGGHATGLRSALDQPLHHHGCISGPEEAHSGRRRDAVSYSIGRVARGQVDGEVAASCGLPVQQEELGNSRDHAIGHHLARGQQVLGAGHRQHRRAQVFALIESPAMAAYSLNCRLKNRRRSA